ncbi:MAG: lipoprotein insertase outer membrane protein LolB [Nevskiales bacterium]|nr:lipoprotein insertase outer membrane protein LolB [Nevskiales bacterium]
MIIANTLVLAGCATHPRSPEAPHPAWETRRTQLAQIHRFTVQARVSSGRLGFNGTLHWRQRPDDFEIRVSGPLGTGAVNIAGNDAEVEIRTTKDHYRATDPERFLSEQLGYTFPVTHLRWWVLGLPAPAHEALLAFDEQGRLRALRQSGWTVDVNEYQNVGAWQLPRKITLANEALTIKVVVDGWTDLPVLQ